MNFGLSFTLRDRFTGPARQIQSSMNSMSSSMDSNMRSVANSIRNTSAALTVAGGLAIRGMSKMAKDGAEFQDTMIMVKNVTTGGAANIGAMEKKIRSLGQSTIFTSSEVASAAEFLGRAGNNAKQVVASLDAAVNLAGATRTELGGKGGASDIMTNIMVAFKKDAADAVEVADKLTAASINSNTHVTGLGESFKYAASTLQGYNIPLEESLALLGVMGSAGIQDSMAGTAVKNLFEFIGQSTSGKFATKRQRTAYEILGIDKSAFINAAGEMKPTAEILRTLFKSLQGLGTVEKNAALVGLFGKRGFRAGQPNIERFKDFEALLKTINTGSKGLAAGIMEERMQGLKGASLELSSSWENLGISFTKAIEPIIKPMVKGLTAIVNVINAIMEIPFIGKFLTAGTAGLIVMGTATAGLVTILTTLRLGMATARSMFTTMVTSRVAGYAAMSTAAKGYAASATAANMAGAGGAFTGAGYYVGGVKQSFKGKIPKGAKWVGSAAQASAMGIGMTATQMQARRMGAKGVLKSSLGSAIRGRGLGIGGALLGRMGLGVVGRVLGVMLGPIGLIASFVLPALISGLSDLTNSTKKLNKEEERALKHKNRQDAQARAARIIAYSEAYRLEENPYFRNRGIVDPRTQIEAERAGYINDQTQTNVNIHVDGQKAIERTINNREERMIYENLGPQ